MTTSDSSGQSIKLHRLELLECAGLFKQWLLSSSLNICTPKRTLSSCFDSKLGSYFTFISF